MGRAVVCKPSGTVTSLGTHLAVRGFRVKTVGSLPGYLPRLLWILRVDEKGSDGLVLASLPRSAT